jgi:P4 family phage/plasmid primase-like protien
VSDEPKAGDLSELNYELASAFLQADPDIFFAGQQGLRVQTLAAAVRARIDLGRLVMHRDADADDALWYCRDGLWRPGAKHEVERVCSQLLGERLRSSYVSNVLLALRTSDLPLIEDGPPHPPLINFANGMLAYMTEVFISHESDTACQARSTVRLAVPWKPDAVCPRFDAWVHQVLPPDCYEFIDEVIGYLMLNGNPLHKAILLHGSGRNGKGTFLRIVVALLGRANCSSVPLQTLGENRFATAELHMKLANVAGDLDSRHVEATNVFKMVTGQDMIYAERKNMQPFRFVSWAVPIFSANLIPTSSDTSVGYLSRWEVIPFPVNLHDLPGGIDPSIEESIITSELPGIARRGVKGLQRLMARGGFDRPESVTEAFTEFERRLDQARHWLDERATDRNVSDAWTYRTDTYNDYLAWARANGHEKPLSAGKFYERIESAGIRPKQRKIGSSSVRGFALRLVTPPPVDPPTADETELQRRLRRLTDGGR